MTLCFHPGMQGDITELKIVCLLMSVVTFKFYIIQVAAVLFSMPSRVLGNDRIFF